MLLRASWTLYKKVQLKPFATNAFAFSPVCDERFQKKTVREERLTKIDGKTIREERFSVYHEYFLKNDSKNRLSQTVVIYYQKCT